MKKIVSFDFDETLDRGDVFEYAERLVKRGYELWIVTARPEYMDGIHCVNEDLWSRAGALQIPKERVVFTSYDLKSKYLNEIKPIWHLDDSEIELMFINIDCNNIAAIDSTSIHWLSHCEELLKEEKI